MVDAKGIVIHLLNVIASILLIVIGAYTIAEKSMEGKVSHVVGGVYLMYAFTIFSLCFL
jgi:uncharacterized membrane protein